MTNLINVSVDFVISALEDRYEAVKDNWGCEASEALWEQVLNLVSECGLGADITSPSIYVDTYLINGEFVSIYNAYQNGYISKDDCTYDEDEEQWVATTEAWSDFCQDNASIYNNEYACLQF